MTTLAKARTIALGLLVLTVGQLAVGTFVPGLTQFAGKGFGARLVFYPVLMLIMPVSWRIRARRRRPAGSQAGSRASSGSGPDSGSDDGGSSSGSSEAAPWAAFAWIMLPFLIDVTGNTLNLYDSISWWDDVNHLVNWFFLSLGIGSLLARAGVRPVWALGLLIAGVGAVLAIGWEVGEYFTFIRHSSELTTAYTDTLGDEVNGTLGASLAALLVARRTQAQAPAMLPAATENTIDYA